MVTGKLRPFERNGDGGRICYSPFGTQKKHAGIDPDQFYIHRQAQLCRNAQHVCGIQPAHGPREFRMIRFFHCRAGQALYLTASILNPYQL